MNGVGVGFLSRFVESMSRDRRLRRRNLSPLLQKLRSGERERESLNQSRSDHTVLYQYQ